MASRRITADCAIDLIFASDGSDGPAVGRLSSNDDFSFSSEEDWLSSLSEGSFAKDCNTIFGHVDMTIYGHILSLPMCKKDFFILSENIGGVHTKVSSLVSYKRSKPNCQFCIQICRTVKG